MKKSRIKIIALLIALLTIIMANNAVMAETTGSFTVSGGGNLNIGDSGTITVSCTNCEGQFTVTSSDSSVIKVNKSSDWVTGSGTFSISAVGKGNATITITPTDVADNQATSEEVTVSKSVKFTVNSNETPADPEPSTPAEPEQPAEPEAPSSNANLSNLGYTPNDFTGFTPGQTEYYTTVPNDVTSISVYAYPQDDGASYSVSGNTNLDVGTNRVTVTVTAEDGTQKTYTMYVSRKEKEEKDEVTPNVIDEDKKDEKEKEDEEKLKVISIAIDDEKEIYLEPQFKSSVYKYTINIKDKDKPEKEKITTIPLKVVANQQDAEIKITGNEKLKDGENIIKITVTSKDGKEKVEYTIIVKKNVEEKPRTTYNPDAAKYSDPHIQYGWIIIGGVLVLFTIILVIIIIRWRKNKKKKEQEDEYINPEEEKIEEKQNYEEELEDKLDYEEEIVEEKKRRRGRSYKNGKHS